MDGNRSGFDSSSCFRRGAGPNRLTRVLSGLNHFAALATLLLAGLLSCTGSARADITYIYDPAGRLSDVISSTGQVVQYTYDADGNITNALTFRPTGVAIYSLAPKSGAQGTTVTIYGIGFSSTPSQDTVTFNGTAATVTSATTTTISTTVPSGATTGPVAVTSPNGSATGPTFTIP
jgi:large repetitive protein